MAIEAIGSQRTFLVLSKALDNHAHHRKPAHGAGAEIGKALGVGSDDAHAVGARGRHHCALLCLAAGAGLAEARGHHDGDLDAPLGAGGDRRHCRLARNRHDREFGRLR